MKTNFLLFSLLLLFTTCNKNNTPKPDHSGMFIKFFGSAQDDAGFSVEATGDGGFVIVGSTITDGRQDKDLYIVKTDADGNKIWDQKYGGLYDEEGLDVKVDKHGNFLVGGYVKNKKDSSNCLIVKFDRNGNLLNQFNFGLSKYNEVANFISIDEDENILVAGSRESQTEKNMYMAKVTMDSIVWQRELGLNGLYDDIGTIVETPSHDILWCGTTTNGNYTDVRICFTDSHSNLYWSYTLGQGDDYNQSGMEVQATREGNYIIAGKQSDASGNNTVYLAKINPLGTLLWSKQPGGFGKSANAVCATSDGGYVIAGSADNDYLVMKVDSEGNELWEHTYGGKGKDRAEKIIQTRDNDFLLIGTVYIANNYALGLIKTNAKGMLDK
jgi:hypothetical protein